MGGSSTCSLDITGPAAAEDRALPKVLLSGHEYIYPVSDLLKLFYGSFHAEGNAVTGGGDEPVIRSECVGATIRTSFFNGRETRVWAGGPEGLPPNREVKRQLYRALAELTGRTFPWGSLTGIRPTLIAAECGYDPRRMAEIYDVSMQKAEIAVRTARRENALLDGIPENAVHLYIGIPFCASRCEYCSFPTTVFDRIGLRLPAYTDTLIRELDEFRPVFVKHPGSLYIGGGTPTAMPADLFRKVMEKAGAIFREAGMTEFTVEAGRPDSVNAENLRIMKDAGAGRICINPQSFRDETLRRIGRRHSAAQVYEAVKLARDAGFGNINMDLIAGLPGETLADFRYSLTETLSLSPAGITIHSLSLKRTSDLKRNLSASSPEDVFGEFGRYGADTGEMLEYSYHALAEKGYKPYYMYRQKDTVGGHENIGYALDGCECAYNAAMMGDRHTVFGAGAKAMSKRAFPGGRGVRIERFRNPADPGVYIDGSTESFNRKRAFFHGYF